MTQSQNVVRLDLRWSKLWVLRPHNLEIAKLRVDHPMQRMRALIAEEFKRRYSEGQSPQLSGYRTVREPRATCPTPAQSTYRWFS